MASTTKIVEEQLTAHRIIKGIKSSKCKEELKNPEACLVQTTMIKKIEGPQKIPSVIAIRFATGQTEETGYC